MREKILLIDGHSILNRAYYGLPDLTNSEGLHTNAIYGFLNILFRRKSRTISPLHLIFMLPPSGIRCTMLTREPENPCHQS